MSSNQPCIVSAGPKQRRFAASAVAVQAIIINPEQEILLLSSTRRGLGWQLVSGALEAGETLVDGALREVREEAGSHLQVRPLGAVHIETFHYDERVQYALAAYYLFAYQEGVVIPGDDMIGSAVRWWSLAKLEDSTVQFHVTARLWLLRRAVDLYRLWVNQPDVPLQAPL